MNKTEIKSGKRQAESGNRAGFTLIELLVVISIIGVLAALTIPVLRGVKRQQYLKVAGAELAQIETALDGYKAKYGAYPPGTSNPLLNELYYELSGTEVKGSDYVTLDGSSTISFAAVNAAYGVGGFINNTHGGAEDGVVAQNFLPGLKANEIAPGITNTTTPAIAITTILVTKDGGPDQKYQPLGASGINPIRYLYPGKNNPNSYDLWVQLVINGQTNLVCNWSKNVIINSPLP